MIKISLSTTLTYPLYIPKPHQSSPYIPKPHISLSRSFPSIMSLPRFPLLLWNTWYWKTSQCKASDYLLLLHSLPTWGLMTSITDVSAALTSTIAFSSSKLLQLLTLSSCFVEVYQKCKSWEGIWRPTMCEVISAHCSDGAIQIACWVLLLCFLQKFKEQLDVWSSETRNN